MEQVTVSEAHSRQSSGSTYVDVRSSMEFEQGHPAGAVNVPLVESDGSGQMTPNPDFLKVMQHHFPTDAKLLIGCQMGGRSMHAAQLLASQGYAHVANVLGGFGGSRVDAGWAGSGLPVENGAPAGKSYADLARAAGA